MPNNNDKDGSQEDAANMAGTSGRIALSDELVRMAQKREAEHGVNLENELARMVAEEAILAIACEDDFAAQAGLMLEDSASISQSDVLAAAVGANELVVNGRQIDVRPLQAATVPAVSAVSAVSIDRILVGTPYLAHGSLVVALDRASTGTSGRVIGYITPNAWLKAEAAQKNSGSQLISLDVQSQSDSNIDAAFDLKAVLAQICLMPSFKLPSMSRIDDLKGDLTTLVNDRASLISARQKQIFAYISTNWQSDIDDLLPLVESVPVKLSPAKLAIVLRQSSLWQGRSERLLQKLSERFAAIDPAALRQIVAEASAMHGSQVTAPRFRRSLLARLVAMDLSAKNAKSPLKAIFATNKAQNLVEKLLAGEAGAGLKPEAAIDAVKHVVANHVAVDLAFHIQKQRENLKKVKDIVAASAEELGFAYGQLALQPAYATHSQTEESGVDSVNEALVLLAAAGEASRLQSLEQDLALI
jgi:hypothetical protein